MVEELPAWLLDALAQAEACSRDGRVPTVLLHRTGDRHTRALVVLRLDAFLELLGPEGGYAA